MAFIAAIGLAAMTGAAQEGATDRYPLELTVDGAPADWSADAPASRDGDALVVPAGTEVAVIRFGGGWLELLVADLGTWDEAHVVGVRRSGEGGVFRFDATVRHADTGWDHYADQWRVAADGADGSVENGVRELLHPHETEQPFTRSQSGVRASGRVWIEARDSVHGFGGSRIGLDLDDPAAPREVSWRVAGVD